MPYAYAPPRGFSVPVALAGAYTPPRGFVVPVILAPPGDLPAANDDTYDTGKHFPLTVVAPGVLANDVDPAGDGLTAVLDDDVAHGTLTFNDDGSFHYVPDASFIGTDTFTYHVVDGNSLESAPATVSIAVSLLPVTRYEQVSSRLPWSHAPRLMRAVASGFSMSARVGRTFSAPFGDAPAVGRAVAVTLERSQRVARTVEIEFDKAPGKVAKDASLPSGKAPAHQVDSVLPWGVPPSVQGTASLPFRAPPARQLAPLLPWTVPPVRQRSASAPYRHPPVRERRWWLPWQHAPAVQWHVRGRTVTPPAVDPEPPQFDPGRGFAIAVPIACPLPPLRGFAVPVHIGPAACYFARPRPRSYIVLNTVSVTATLTGHVVECTDVSTAESMDDTHHSFTLTLADPADLVWLQPTNIDPSPIAIEININGHLRTGIVEAWSTETQFPGKGITVSGRALSALLDAPYAPPRAYLEASDRTSQQLIDQELDSTGYTADYDIVDWAVPAGAWHYDNLTRVAAVRRVAEAAGAIARAHPWDTVIEILPRYPVSPWDWGTTSPDKTVVDDYVPRLAESGGVSAMPTYEIRLPLWPSSDTSKPGLLRPGQLVEFAAADDWKAQVAAVRISASLQQSGSASALVVWQDVTLEAPPAAPRHNYVLVSGEQVGVSDPVVRDGTAGDVRLPQIVDALITEHAVAAERGRNAIAAGGDAIATSNLWAQLVGLQPQGRYLKGNVLAVNGDGSYSIATSDGSTIRARALPGQTWSVLDGVFVQDGRIVDSAPSLTGVTQTV